MAAGPLKLRAVDEDDLAVLAACLQDALVPVHDMRFIAEDSSFVLVANRFCWEKLPPSAIGSEAVEGAASVENDVAAEDDIAAEADGRFERVHSALSIEHVKRCQTRGFSPTDPAEADRLLEILTVMYEDGALTLVFAGDAAVRLEVDGIEAVVQDVGEPWPTMWRPSHPLGEEEGP